MRINFVLLIIIKLVLSAGTLFTQDNVKIMTYNLLNYPDVDSVIRNPNFRKVIRNSNPDILVVQEMTSLAGMSGFLNNVMNAYGNIYSMGTFIDGPDTDNGIFFRTSKFQFISNTRIRTSLRDINEFKIIHLTYPDDTLRIYSVHLKASSGITNENLRAAEVDSLRKFTNQLAMNSFYIVAGDFNIYGDYEPAYQKLLLVNGNNRGHFKDMIPGMTGVWNNFNYRHYHTQSTRTRGFGGGATGGLDDRFDMILVSPEVSSGGRIAYVPGTMTAYGNDGNHYNDSINKRPNTAVTDSVADALHYAADHLPVYAIFTFGNPIGITGNQNTSSEYYKLDQNYPNPFNPVTNIKFSIPTAVGNGRDRSVNLIIYDHLGRKVSTLVNEHLSPGIYTVDWNAAGYSSGVYFYTLSSGSFRETKKMILLK